MPFTLLRNANLYAPEAVGQCDILIAAGKILAIEPHIEISANVDIDVVDCTGFMVTPGLVDSLTHITGGGGEGGFATRTPEMQLSDAINGGVTTVTGALGTDATCRTHAELIAKAKALKEEGLSAFVYTGNYHFPVKTVIGSVQHDIMLIDECIGVGEIAIADHRGSQITWRELASVAADARVGGMCAKKAGIVLVHVGSGPDKLQTIFDVAEHTQIPLSQFYPTHMNRNLPLLKEGVRFNQAGGYIDFTASSTPGILDDGEVKCARALKTALALGADADRITFSTDGHASLPHFNSLGELESLEVGSMSSMFNEFRDAVQVEGIDLTTALKAVTKNPASVLKLTKKGRIAVGCDADILLIQPDGFILDSVMANGQWFKKHQQTLRKGTFE